MISGAGLLSSLALGPHTRDMHSLLQGLRARLNRERTATPAVLANSGYSIDPDCKIHMDRFSARQGSVEYCFGVPMCQLS